MDIGGLVKILRDDLRKAFAGMVGSDNLTSSKVKSFVPVILLYRILCTKNFRKISFIEILLQNDAIKKKVIAVLRKKLKGPRNF